MGGKGKKTKWKKLSLENIASNSDLGDTSNVDDDDKKDNAEANFPEVPPDGDKPSDDNAITGCYINGLWMPLDYEQSIAYYPQCAPYTVLPSVWTNDLTFHPIVFDIETVFNDVSKRRNSNLYWTESYMPLVGDNELMGVPYLYPGYTFGPSVYSVPLAEFPFQGIRKKRKKRKPRSFPHELRQLEPGVDAISTPSCDVIRYSTLSAVENREKIKSIAIQNMTENSETCSTSDTKQNCENSNEIDAVKALPDLASNQTENTVAVRTISRFKVYPCPNDPLRNKLVEDCEKKEVPLYHNYLTSSDTLLRETELELTKLNKKAFQANQAIYKLAYDDSVTDEDSRPESRSEPIEPKFDKAVDLPEDLKDIPGNRMEIEVHELDTASEAGSEDVEILVHRYESGAPPEKHVYVNKLSLATELLRTRENLPYDSEFKRLVDEDQLITEEFQSKQRVSRADSGVQSEESGDEIIEDIKAPVLQQREDIWSSAEGKHYLRQVPNRIPYISRTQRGGPFPPCLCCIIM